MVGKTLCLSGRLHKKYFKPGEPGGHFRPVCRELEHDKERQMSIWTILFLVLLVVWIGGFTVFHVAGGLIHLLLVFAVISLILHFVLGARTA
jgi:hypothetical protein